MRLRRFVRAALEEMDAVPEVFRRGVSGPVVIRRARRHRTLPGLYTLGMCVTPPVEAAFTDEHLSTVVLFYGSFVACSMRDPAFDMATELRETVRHEIRHHIEDAAGAPHLRNEDAAEEQNERRREGLPFQPGFHRFGIAEGPGVWRVGRDLFVEPDRLPSPPRGGDSSIQVPLPRGRALRIPLPLAGEVSPGDLVAVEGVASPAGGEVVVALPAPA